MCSNFTGCSIREFCNIIKNAIILFYGKAEDAKRREENLEEAKKITIEEDTSLPPAKKVT